MKTLKIIFLDQCLGGGGAERVMCTIMRALDPKKFNIHLVIVTALGELNYLIPEYVVLHELDVSNTRKALPAYIRKLREIRPDVVFTTTGRTAILAVIGRLFAPAQRLVVRYPTMPSRIIQSGELKSWRLWFMKRMYRFADLIIAQSDEMAEELRRHYSIPTDKIRTISNPVDGLFISQSLEDLPNPFDTSHLNLVASGRLVELKGFDVLLDAFALVQVQHPSSVLHFLGEDSEGLQPALEAQAQRLGIFDAVRFHGFVPNPYPFYKHCDLFVLSSRHEGCPNVLLECLYLGKRVAATRCVPIVERIVSGRLGALAEVDDAQSLAGAMNEAMHLESHGNNSVGWSDSIPLFIKVLEED